MNALRSYYIAYLYILITDTLIRVALGYVACQSQGNKEA